MRLFRIRGTGTYSARAHTRNTLLTRTKDYGTICWYQVLEAPTMVVSADAAQRLETALARMTVRQRVAFLLNAGVPADHVIGTADCFEHLGWHPLPEARSLTFDLTTLWCRKCWRWWHS